ncbi:hypothetical protein BMEGG_06152 [Priestia megaterium]|uniref:hypothetical protein n=1 Tax=Priestia megaterium TaxID=1404 RepID=UPI002F5544CD
MSIEENYMNTDEMSLRLKLSGSNVRKYSAALEKSGYTFKTGSKNKRYYTDKDQMVLAQLKYLIQDKNLSLEVGAKAVVEALNKNRAASGAHDEQNENEENNHSLTVPQPFEKSLPPEVIGAIAEQFKQQQEINNELLGIIEGYKAALSDSKNDLRESEEQRRADREQTSKQLEQLQASFDKQAEQMKKHIESRDKEMMEYIRSSQKQQQQNLLEAAAAQEKEREHKKGFFARLFGN